MKNKSNYFTTIKRNFDRIMELRKAKDEISTDNEKRVFNFFTKNKPPIKDDDYHKFAESENMTTDEAEQIAYNLLSSLLSGGLSKGVVDFDVDKNELEMGVEVEKEHTNNILLARKIALDHLKEHSDYYTKLNEAGL